MKATVDSWRTKPFKAGALIPYRRTFSQEQTLRLYEGLIPRVMEDKWFIYFQEPHLFFHRGWTGDPIYRLALAPKDGGVTVSEAMWTLSREVIRRAGTFGDNQEERQAFLRATGRHEAEMVNFLLSNLLLGEFTPFPMPADVSPEQGEIYQHAMSGTAYPVDRKKDNGG